MGLKASDYISAVTRRRSWVGSVALVVLACAMVVVTAIGSPRRLAVTGFQDATSEAPAVIDRSASALTTVAVDGVALRPDGGGVMPVEEAVQAGLRHARADHLRAELVVNNWNARFQDFAEPTATRLLTNRANIRRVSAELAALVISQEIGRAHV